MKTNIYDVEIAPTCNFQCPNCLLGNRLRGTELRYDRHLAQKLIDYVPLGSHLNYVGLGEPTQFASQANIHKIHERRTDLTGHIQTNGSYPILENLLSQIGDGKLTVGLSYDLHHTRGNVHNQGLRIQPHLVNSLSIAVEPQTQTQDLYFGKTFSQLSHVLVDPLFNAQMQISGTWDETHKIVRTVQERNPGLRVYTGLHEAWLTQNSVNAKYFQDAIASGLQHIGGRWFLHPDRYVVRIEKPDFGGLRRILIDGRVTSDTFDMIKTWSQIDTLDLKRIESLCDT